MPYPSYLNIDEYSAIRQNGCIPLAWLAALRDAQPVDTEAGGFWGWESTPWETTDSIDRAINVLQRDEYLWAYFNILSLLLEEIQQVPTEEPISFDVSEFAAVDPAREQAARGASDNFRAMLRMLHRGERDAALAALRQLSADLNLDAGLPFTGDLDADIAAMGGSENALQELTWSIMGEIYEGPAERAEWYTPEHYRINFWHWLAAPGPAPAPKGAPKEAPPADGTTGNGSVIAGVVNHNGSAPEL
ncbi:MAG TPA: hypothetical protein VFM49_00065 [Chloroflexia bacterium]|jgi:hypothetical protein|nr:hypothetical protein [Chloroflexia bacterium]